MGEGWEGGDAAAVLLTLPVLSSRISCRFFTLTLTLSRQGRGNFFEHV